MLSNVVLVEYTTLELPVAPVQTKPYPDLVSRVGTAVNYNLGSSYWYSNADALAYREVGLPGGLAMDVNTGIVTGTPNTASTSQVDIYASNSEGETGPGEFQWTVVQPGATIPNDGKTITDARFFALRDQGFLGSTNDMIREWLVANGATNHVATSDMWMEALIARLPDEQPIEDAYLNGALAGGAYSEPGNLNPPTNHTFGTDITSDAEPTPDGWVFNEAGKNKIVYLEYDMWANNPGGTVGEQARVEIDMERIDTATGTLTAIEMVDYSGISFTGAKTDLASGERALLYYNFTITETPYAATLRFGCGVTGSKQKAAYRVYSPVKMLYRGDAPLHPKQRNDMMYLLLGLNGFTGSLNDRELAFWQAGGGTVDLDPLRVQDLADYLVSQGWDADVIPSGKLRVKLQGQPNVKVTLQELIDYIYQNLPGIPAALVADIDYWRG